MIARLFPQPTISVFILGMWLVLAGSIGVGHILLGSALALVIPHLTQRFWPDRPVLRRPGLAVRLFGILLFDIVVANWEVAVRVLGPMRRIRPAFVTIPLDTDEPFVATLLASMITLTPGTLSVDVDPAGRALLIHGLDVPDEQALIATIKARYEAPLKEIFGC